MTTTNQPAAVYLNLRQMILSLSPGKAGLLPTPSTPHVWGMLMEMGYPEGTATLVMLTDGTTSLYYSHGGGMLGCGTAPAVTEATLTCLETAEGYLPQMRPARDFSLPAPWRICFYVLTFQGVFSAEGPEVELNGGEHPFCGLYIAAQAVLTQVRLLSEKP
jgi:hypothetical protein